MELFSAGNDRYRMLCRWGVGTLTADHFEPVVARGADFLDRMLGAPEWRPKIVPAGLQLASDRKCVLGQLYGDYGTGVERLRLTTGQEEAFGFHLPGSVQVQYAPANSWDVLTEAWRQELARV